ncbi:hypothetical protein CMI37_10390 [Candidatus Pacearchaeota archaeon]|nr:hypothetical protein [Candidatus Pacearchaeota archaeon]|tara:strand:+ start:4739 stop:5035 length:297 start_codon:yes stop_codon:yes gene_type:complete
MIDSGDWRVYAEYDVKNRPARVAVFEVDEGAGQARLKVVNRKSRRPVDRFTCEAEPINFYLIGGRDTGFDLALSHPLDRINYCRCRELRRAVSLVEGD